jgi:hypothetical protein
MGEPIAGDVLSNTLGDLGIPLDLSPTRVELLVIGDANPILYKRP